MVLFVSRMCGVFLNEDDSGRKNPVKLKQYAILKQILFTKKISVNIWQL